MSATRTRRASVGGLLLAVVAVVIAVLLAPAVAVPPDGIPEDTPGTSASVSPSTVAVGGVINFTVKGYPGGETLYIKIDDEKYCTSPPYGACVYHQQKIPANGTITGSFQLPAGLKPGQHQLRFLASKLIEDGDNVSVKGYTRPSPTFTVVAAGSTGSSGSGSSAGSGSSSDSDASTTTNDTTTDGTSGAAAADQTPAGQVVMAAPLSTAEATESPTDDVQAAGEPVAAAVTADDGLVPVPWIGMAVLVACLLASSVVTSVVLWKRRD